LRDKYSVNPERIKNDRMIDLPTYINDEVISAFSYSMKTGRIRKGLVQGEMRN
jgi:hypothetical protein